MSKKKNPLRSISNWVKDHRTNFKDAAIFVLVFYAIGAVIDTTTKLFEPYGPHTSLPVRMYVHCAPQAQGTMLCTLSFSRLRTVSYAPNDMESK